LQALPTLRKLSKSDSKILYYGLVYTFFGYSVSSLADGPESSVDAWRLTVDRRVSVPNFINKFPTVPEIRRSPESPWGRRYGEANFELWSRFPQNWGVTYPRILHFGRALSSGCNTEALHTQTNSPGGAKMSKSAKITHRGSIRGFITPNPLRQPHNAIHRWKGL